MSWPDSGSLREFVPGLSRAHLAEGTKAAAVPLLSHSCQGKQGDATKAEPSHSHRGLLQPPLAPAKHKLEQQLKTRVLRQLCKCMDAHKLATASMKAAAGLEDEASSLPKCMQAPAALRWESELGACTDSAS